MAPIEVGDPAPEFTAIASDGQPISLAGFKGKQVVVLFFYPRDHSHICTQEACSFRDMYEDFAQLGAVVIGVSGDSDERHRAFAETNRLPYLMISDRDGQLRRLFGVSNALFLIPGRETFVIDRNGIVQHRFNSLLSGTKHAEEALQSVRKLNGQASGSCYE